MSGEGRQDYLQRLADEIVVAVDNGLPSVALAAALTIPDICGRIDSADCRASGVNYSAWVDQYIVPQYLSPGWPLPAAEGEPLLVGGDFYALRCSALHEGRDETAHQRANRTYQGFILHVSQEARAHLNYDGTRKTLMLDINVLCRQVAAAYYEWNAAVISDPVRMKRRSEVLTFFGTG